MATYVLIHGGGGRAESWNLVSAELQELGHDVVAVDLPSDDASAKWSDYADAVVAAISNRTELVVVAHSMGGFTGPLVCDRVHADLLVLVAGMVPAPGETFEEWWTNTGHDQAKQEQAERAGRAVGEGGTVGTFYHDAPPHLAAADMARGEGQYEFPKEPWPLASWPDVPTRYLLCRDDRCFPADFTRRVVQERLGMTPDEIDGSHSPYLARPKELAARLEAYRLDRH